jgi:dephospho-CoA kinase
MNEKFIVGLVGMPGAGKSVVVSVAKENGYGVVVMGDVVREEAERQCLNPTPKILGKIMLELRRREGNTVVARRCISKIKEAKEAKIIVDGIRSLSEVEEFKRHFRNFALVAIHSCPETRFRRLYRRQRSDDPKSWELFLERDMRELSVGLANAIALAEYIIVNEERVEDVKVKAREVLRKVERKWIK